MLRNLNDQNSWINSLDENKKSDLHLILLGYRKELLSDILEFEILFTNWIFKKINFDLKSSIYKNDQKKIKLLKHLIIKNEEIKTDRMNLFLII